MNSQSMTPAWSIPRAACRRPTSPFAINDFGRNAAPSRCQTFLLGDPAIVIDPDVVGVDGRSFDLQPDEVTQHRPLATAMPRDNGSVDEGRAIAHDDAPA